MLAWSGGTNALQFADTEVGKTAAGNPLTLVNNGPGSVTLSSIGTTGAQASAFSVSGGTCMSGTALAAGASCTVIVSFVPDIAGARAALLRVTSNGSNPPDVALSGSGVSGSTGGGTPTPTTGTLAVSPSVLDYRSITVRTGGRSDPLTVRISSNSAASATIQSVTTTAGFIVASGSSSDACPGVPWTLAAGKSCTVTVVFAPSTGGEMTGTLKVMSAAGQATEVQLSAQAETVATNQGGGALGVHWLVLLSLAIAALQWPRRIHPRSL